MIAQSTAKVASSFMVQHFECLTGAGNDLANRGLRFVYDGDEEFDNLPLEKEQTD